MCNLFGDKKNQAPKGTRIALSRSVCTTLELLRLALEVHYGFRISLTQVDVVRMGCFSEGGTQFDIFLEVEFETSEAPGRTLVAKMGVNKLLDTCPVVPEDLVTVRVHQPMEGYFDMLDVRFNAESPRQAVVASSFRWDRVRHTGSGYHRNERETITWNFEKNVWESSRTA